MVCEHRDIWRLTCRGCGKSVFEIGGEPEPQEPDTSTRPGWWFAVVFAGYGGAALAWVLVVMS